MSVKDILVAAFEKDASSFETAFSSVMKEKVSAAVENKFFAAEEYELDESKYEDEEDEDEEDEDEEEDDEDELEEKKLTAKDVKHALASAKAKPKETVSLKKPPFKMEEVEQMDELSKDTLRSYNDKSKKSSKELGAKLDSAPKDLTGNFRVKDHPTLDKLRNRVRGQRLAHGRLTSEEVELDEVSSKLLRRAAKAADYNHQAQIDMQKEYEPNRKTPAPSVQAAGARAMKFRVAALKKDYTKKEEVDLDEASETLSTNALVALAKKHQAASNASGQSMRGKMAHNDHAKKIMAALDNAGARYEHGGKYMYKAALVPSSRLTKTSDSIFANHPTSSDKE